MGNRILGIDLGTVNSCVAVVKDGKAVVLRDETQATIPSCLGLQRGKEIVGAVAKRHLVTDPANTATCVKRLLGHAFDSDEVQQATERAPYAIRPSPLGSVLLEIGGRELTPVQVSARILQKVRAVAEESLGEPVERAVISVPAHFTDVQRKSTKVAAEYAGIEVVRLINEPTAAAFAYGYRKAEDFTLAVYDLGGGTFDITIMTGRGDTFEVDATDGDSYLGGEDFDHAIADWLLAEFEEEYGVDLSEDESARLRIKESAERAKIELTELLETQIDLPFLTELPDGSRPHFVRTLSRGVFVELVRPLVQRTMELCARCLEAAGLVKDDVDDVLLVGGQSRMPAVREAVAEFFGREARRDINPDEVVAIGAALFGYSLLAPEFKHESIDAAGEAYEVAYKRTEVARRFLEDVQQVQADQQLTGDRLAERLKELLDEAEAELPTFSGPALSEEDLPIAVSQLREELMEIERKADEVMLRAAQETQGIPEDWGQEIEQVQQRISEGVSAAQEASAEAEKHLLEAEELGRARRVDLIDVTSHSLGIAAAGDVATVLIDRNTVVPADANRVFTTQENGQTEVEIRVFQGEGARASENQQLGNFILEGIPPARRMEPKIDVRFHIDEDGILSVSASEASSGARQEIRVEDPLALQQEKQSQG